MTGGERIARRSERASVVSGHLRQLEESSSISQEQYEVIAEHVDQVEYEFIAKLSIACVLLACLMVWFTWSFWWDKNMRRSLASRRRRGQWVPRLERTSSLGSPPPPGEDTNPSSQGMGVGVGYQRDSHAVGRSGQQQRQAQGHKNNGHGTLMTEFFNPMWEETSTSGDRHTGFRERSAPPDRGDEPGGSSRNASVAPHERKPPQQQRRWRASR